MSSPPQFALLVEGGRGGRCPKLEVDFTPSAGFVPTNPVLAKALLWFVAGMFLSTMGAPLPELAKLVGLDAGTMVVLRYRKPSVNIYRHFYRYKYWYFRLGIPVFYGNAGINTGIS